MNAEPTTEEVRRLRWQCRRGMLELDVALIGFLERDYPQLDGPRQAAFGRLLKAQDQVLHAWLMGREIPEDSVFRELVARLRAQGSGAT